jgi:hypothetical protein
MHHYYKASNRAQWTLSVQDIKTLLATRFVLVKCNLECSEHQLAYVQARPGPRQRRGFNSLKLKRRHSDENLLERPVDLQQQDHHFQQRSGWDQLRCPSASLMLMACETLTLKHGVQGRGEQLELDHLISSLLCTTLGAWLRA